MIVNCVHVHVKSDKIEDFKRAAIENHVNSIQESGILRFDIIQNEAEPDKFILYEAYESEEAIALHKTTKHYAKWRDTVADWMAGPRQGIRYTVVAPMDKTLW